MNSRPPHSLLHISHSCSLTSHQGFRGFSSLFALATNFVLLVAFVLVRNEITLPAPGVWVVSAAGFVPVKIHRTTSQSVIIMNPDKPFHSEKRDHGIGGSAARQRWESEYPFAPIPMMGSSSSTQLNGMQRPLLDQIASTLFNLENKRVQASSKLDEKGRLGEPMEWSEPDSMANQFSKAIASNPAGYRFKQWVADIVAGDFNETAVMEKMDRFVAQTTTTEATPKVAMFSFSTCPFCRRAKDALDERGIPYVSMELDELEGNQGNEIRAVLGRRYQRTSVPAIFIQGKYIGGCNDGNPGLMPLLQSGELERLLMV